VQQVWNTYIWTPTYKLVRSPMRLPRPELQDLFERRLAKAPKNIRSAIFGQQRPYVGIWEIDDTILFFAGSQGAIGHALKRNKSFKTPFPNLLSRSSAAMFRIPDGVTTGTLEDITLDVGDKAVASLGVQSCLTMVKTRIKWGFRDKAGSTPENYDINLLVVYRHAGDSGAILNSVEVIESSLTRYITKTFALPDESARI
jgi:hypothetical protein